MTKAKTIGLRKALAAMQQRGGRLVQMYDNTAPIGRSWCVVPGGRVEAETAAKIIGRDDVISTEDGLFPGHPQTYRIIGAYHD